DTLVVEGDPQPVTLRLVRVDEGALPFATYIPEDLTPEAVASGEGQGHRLVMGNPADAHTPRSACSSPPKAADWAIRKHTPGRSRARASPSNRWATPRRGSRPATAGTPPAASGASAPGRATAAASTSSRTCRRRWATASARAPRWSSTTGSGCP